MATNNAINNAYTTGTSLTVDPGSASDSYIQFDINATSEFRIGVDDTDDSFRISQGSALGTNDAFVVSAAGEVTKPLQPAFLAILTSTKTNVTGDKTWYTISWDSEVFDQNADFSGTTFTAPVTGRYRLEVNVTLADLTASHNGGFFDIATSNRTYLIQQNAGAGRDASTNRYSVYCQTLADMDAGDTADVGVRIGDSTLTVDVYSNGATDPATWFSGNLEV